jgi:hypothetical protein
MFSDGAMARIHHRNFGIPSRLQAYPQRRSFLQRVDDTRATLLVCLLLIGAGLAALGWWLVRGALVPMMRGLGSERSLPSPRLDACGSHQSSARVDDTRALR